MKRWILGPLEVYRFREPCARGRHIVANGWMVGFCFDRWQVFWRHRASV